MLIEEYGLKSDSGNAAREATFQTWLAQVVASQGAGAMVWMIAGENNDGQRYPDYDHYTVYAAEDVPSIRAFAQTAALASPANRSPLS
jgi:endo-1,4-beta-mannosidase